MFEKFDLIIRRLLVNRLLKWLIVFGVICIGLIWIIIDTYVLNRLTAPIAVLPSNITANGIAINYLTKELRATCITAYSLWPPVMQRSCDRVPNVVHSLRVSGLAPNRSYYIFIDSGFHFWHKGYESLTGTKLVVFPAIQTKAQKDLIDLTKLVTVIGRVVDQNNTPQFKALVLAGKTGSLENVSSRTNLDGNFSLTIPEISLLDQLVINVWSNQGFIAQTLPTVELIRKPATLIVQNYE